MSFVLLYRIYSRRSVKFGLAQNIIWNLIPEFDRIKICHKLGYNLGISLGAGRQWRPPGALIIDITVHNTFLYKVTWAQVVMY
jgi:hypothetical protein